MKCKICGKSFKKLGDHMEHIRKTECACTKGAEIRCGEAESEECHCACQGHNHGKMRIKK